MVRLHGDGLVYLRLETPMGPMRAVATPGRRAALCGLGYEASGDAWLERLARLWGVRMVPARGRVAVLEQARRELEEYFAGRRRQFSVPVAMRGTAFQRRAWRELGRIGYGTVATYRQQAMRMGLPGGARAVGSANARNPVAIIVPCHRVVARDGLGGYGGGLDRKRWLLALEGVGVAAAGA